jgi:hypothetical protein
MKSLPPTAGNNWAAASDDRQRKKKASSEMSISSRTTIIDSGLKISGRAIDRCASYINTRARAFVDYLRNLPATYPNYLTAAEPEKRRLPSRSLLLLGLVVLCLTPRALLALQIGSICPDGVLYIRLADALKAGRFQEAFAGMRLNIYPVVLMLLSYLGLGWETGGSLWCVLMSSLVVLPLYGFARRQFDDTVALVSCLLYALHPIFIQWSPEIIRDPTFWFFFTLSLYLAWRAVTEVRIDFSLTAGLTVALAILTRYEGFLLLIPVGLWTFWRYRALSSGWNRAKVVLGSLLLAAAFPALLALVNVTWLRHYSEWVFARDPLSRIYSWWNSITVPAPVDTAGSMQQIQTAMSFGRMIAIYIPTLVKAFTPLVGLLTLGGLWGWRGVWKRRDHQPLFYVSLVIMTAIWFHAWIARESCNRYFLPIVVMASMFAALGLLGLSRRILRFAEWLKTKNSLQYTAVFTPWAIVAVVGWCVAFSGPYDRRGAEVKLAAWVRNEFGSSALMCGSEGVTPVVAYYARVRWNVLSKDMDDPTVLKQVRDLKPDVILLLATRRRDLAETRRLVERIIECGYGEMARNDLPPGTDEVLLVLRRAEVRLSAANKSGAKPRLQK